MSVLIKPTIGRVVLFHHVAEADAEPALVCFVHTDRMINVGGFQWNGQPFAACSVPLIPNGEDIPATGHYATWMDYQVEQAKKDKIKREAQEAADEERHA